MPQSLACLYYHFIFSTRDRAPFLMPALQPQLFSYVGGTLRSAGGVLVAAGGMPDHVHLLASIDKTTSISETMRLVKSNSSRWIRDQSPALRYFAWQTGYGAFSVSCSRISHVKTYINNQAEHHRAITFQDEYRAFLERHEIRYDERYLWE